MEKKTGLMGRKLIVNTKLQLTILVYSLTLCLWVTVAGIILQLLAQSHYKTAEFSGTYTLILIGFILLVGTTVIGGLLLTNRIAGPLFRLSSHMREVASGKSSEAIAFRKNDYFAEIIEPYNQILNELKVLRK